MSGQADELHELAALLRAGSTMTLSGAGISTESGIPDYRSPSSLARARNPITYQEFVRDEHARRRYWARSVIGWRVMAERAPNAGHLAIAALERSGHVTGVVTQNVDGLHQEAGSLKVIELHGSLAEARCLNCGSREQRSSLQARLDAANIEFAGRAAELAPDGDADVPAEWVADFVVVACRVCGGVLKPDVVFFGENVPKERLERAWGMLAAADNLLVVGSSLTVMSGYRFVRAAVADGKPVAIVNEGPTRGDDEATLKVTGRLGTVLPTLAELVAE